MGVFECEDECGGGGEGVAEEREGWVEGDDGGGERVVGGGVKVWLWSGHCC